MRLSLLKRKLRVLGEEEVLLLQLMRVVQKDCFEGNKMSMEEYDEAMIQCDPLRCYQHPNGSNHESL